MFFNMFYLYLGVTLLGVLAARSCIGRSKAFQLMILVAVYPFYAEEHDSFRFRKLLWLFLLLCVSLSSIVYGLVCLIPILFDDWSHLVSLFMVCVTPSNALLVTV